VAKHPSSLGNPYDGNGILPERGLQTATILWRS